jgi:gliding motility-associated-like protein
MNEDGEYETIASLNTITDTVFTDQLKDLECAMQSCYRIAVLSTDQQWWSYSNVVCGALESTLFVPNAFTLNHDGLNERFQPRGLYIQDYNLKVYSRWGELIFETEQCMQGWDGKYKGQSADGGVYIYLVQAMGADGKFHIHKGTITVLR